MSQAESQADAGYAAGAVAGMDKRLSREKWMHQGDQVVDRTSTWGCSHLNSDSSREDRKRLSQASKPSVSDGMIRGPPRTWAKRSSAWLSLVP